MNRPTLSFLQFTAYRIRIKACLASSNSQSGKVCLRAAANKMGFSGCSFFVTSPKIPRVYPLLNVFTRI